MSRLVRAVKAWFTEARRAWLYTLVLAATPLLLGLGILNASQADAWVRLAQALLGLAAGTVAALRAEALWRRWLYSIAAALAGLLVVLDVLPSTSAPLVLAIVQAALTSVGGGLSLKNLSPDLPPAVLVDGAYRITLAGSYDGRAIDAAVRQLAALREASGKGGSVVDVYVPKPGEGQGGAGGQH